MLSVGKCGKVGETIPPLFENGAGLLWEIVGRMGNQSPTGKKAFPCPVTSRGVSNAPPESRRTASHRFGADPWPPVCWLLRWPGAGRSARGGWAAHLAR